LEKYANGEMVARIGTRVGILIVWCLVSVFSHDAYSVSLARNWLRWSSARGISGFIAASLFAVYNVQRLGHRDPSERGNLRRPGESRPDQGDLGDRGHADVRVTLGISTTITLYVRFWGASDLLRHA
jgi:hypothetical protein